MENKKCSSEEHNNIQALFYCNKCEIYMCNKCKSIHSKLCKNHNITNLQTDKEGEFSDFCQEKKHSGKLEYYCKIHNQLCCSDCIVKIKREGYNQHSNCNVFYIEDIKSEKINLLKKNLKYLDEASNSISKLKEIIKQNFEYITKKKEELKICVQNVFTLIRNNLNNREEELLLEIDKQYNKFPFNESILIESEKIPNKIKMMIFEGKKIDAELKDKNKLIKIINNCISIEKQIKNLKLINEKNYKIDFENIKAEFIPNNEKEINDFLYKINNFGKINFHIPDKNNILSSKIIFNNEELKDPDCINRLNTFKVLDYKLQKYESISRGIDGRTPKEIMEKIVSIRVKHSKLLELMSESEPQDYYNILNFNLNYDNKLLEYFLSKKDVEKANLVKERLPLIIQEKKEFLQQMGDKIKVINE